MPTAPAVNYSDIRLIPLKNEEAAGKEDVNLAAGTYLAGTLLGEMPATPGTFGAYASSNTSVTTNPQNPTALLEYGCVVDSLGQIWLGDVSGGSEWGQPEKAISVYRNGTFSCADLVGLDAAAVVKLGRIVRGNTTAGELQMYGS